MDIEIKILYESVTENMDIESQLTIKFQNITSNKWKKPIRDKFTVKEKENIYLMILFLNI